jgi:hypothetical protein
MQAAQQQEGEAQAPKKDDAQNAAPRDIPWRYITVVWAQGSRAW